MSSGSSTAEDEGWLEIPLVVEPNFDGYRLDRYLKARIVRMSRARIQAIIERGQVRTPGGETPIVRAAARVRAGQRLVVLRPAPVEPDVTMDYRVVHADATLLVIDKPAGLPVHPSARYHEHTLTALMRTRLGAGHGWEMAHRLDRETSGLMLFGRRRTRKGRHAVESGGVLKRWFQERRIEKRYLAIVRGVVASAMRLDTPLGPAKGSAIRVKMGPRALHDHGLSACTEVTPLVLGRHRDEPVTLVACLPRTGRQHQIRVHLAHAGHPVVGDKLYGVSEQAFLDVMENGRPVAELEAQVGLSRHALHAERIALPHPSDERPLTFEAAWPDDLAAIVPLP